MNDIKRPAADISDDERTYAADIDMSRDPATEAKRGPRTEKSTEDQTERDNAAAIAASTAQTGQT